MRELENSITLQNLDNAKEYLVPHVFTQNYYNILKKRLGKKKLSANEQYYYTHFIKKKVLGMLELFEISEIVNGRQFIREERLQKAMLLIRKYSKIHKNIKILISGSFLFSEKYNDIDVFVISKYKKEDYRDGKIHVNYLPVSIEKTLFFKSIYAISMVNFKSDTEMEEKFDLNEILQLYEIIVLLMMQKDKYIQELRDLIMRLEYVSGNVVLNPLQLDIITKKIIHSKNPIQVISKYLIAKTVNSYKGVILKKVLQKFIEKNSTPEKGRKLYENWKIYNQTYKEALEVVA